MIAAVSSRSATGLRNRALISVLFGSGLRLGEVLALTCRDVDLVAGAVRAAATPTRRVRIVRVDAQVTTAVEGWCARRRALEISDDAPLFCTLNGRSLDPSYVRQLLPRLARRAGIAKKVGAEELRRAHAAQLAAEGQGLHALQARLGHARPDATRRYLRARDRHALAHAAGDGLQRPGTASASSLGLAAAGVLILDAHGRVVDLNASAERILGCARDAILGRAMWSALPADDPTGGTRDRPRSSAQHSSINLTSFRDDHPTWHEVAVCPMPEGFVVLLRDLSDQGHADDLRDSKERYRAIFETAADAIVIVDDHGVIESLNPAAESMFGYARDELVGANVSVLMPEPYRSEHAANLARYRETGERHIIGIGREVLGRTKDGRTLRLRLSVGEMLIGGERKFTGILQDISERTRIEEELRQIELRTRRLEERARGRQV